MFAGLGYLLGYDGHYDFGAIGESYIENGVPCYIGLRALPASLNVASVWLVYAIMKQSGYLTFTCVFSTAMFMSGNVLKESSVSMCILMHFAHR